MVTYYALNGIKILIISIMVLHVFKEMMANFVILTPKEK